MEKPRHKDAELIEKLGGTVAVSRIFEIKPPSVSEWKRDGIPKPRRQYLQLLRPDLFGPEPQKAA